MRGRCREVVSGAQPGPKKGCPSSLGGAQPGPKKGCPSSLGKALPAAHTSPGRPPTCPKSPRIKSPGPRAPTQRSSRCGASSGPRPWARWAARRSATTSAAPQRRRRRARTASPRSTPRLGCQGGGQGRERVRRGWRASMRMPRRPLQHFRTKPSPTPPSPAQLTRQQQQHQRARHRRPPTGAALLAALEGALDHDPGGHGLGRWVAACKIHST